MLKTDYFKKVLKQPKLEVTSYITIDGNVIYPEYSIKKRFGRTVILTSCDDYIESIALFKVKGGMRAVRCFMNLSDTTGSKRNLFKTRKKAFKVAT